RGRVARGQRGDRRTPRTAAEHGEAHRACHEPPPARRAACRRPPAGLDADRGAPAREEDRLLLARGRAAAAAETGLRPAGGRRGVAERVPSGAITSEIPSSRSLATAGSSARRAWRESPRSTNATPASWKSWPKPGTFFASALATPVNPLRSSFIKTIGSSLDWWLNTNTQG